MGSGGTAPLILNSALDGSQRSTSRSRRLTSVKRDPGWVHSRSGCSLPHAGNRTRSRSPANIRLAKSLFGLFFYFYFDIIKRRRAAVRLYHSHNAFRAHHFVRWRPFTASSTSVCVCVCVCVCVTQWDGRCSCVGRLPLEI